jgi:hypothetical protein
MALPKTGATELVSGQATPETSVNEALRHLDAGYCRAMIVDRDLTAPPGTCADGANYLVASSPTGLWSGQAGKLATAVGTNASNGWLFQTVAVEGFRLYVRDENAEIYYDGAAWVSAGSAVSEASNSEVWTGSAADRFISPNRLFSSSAPVALTSGATITPDCNTGFNFSLTIEEDATLANPSNFKVGQSGIIVITQDGTGGWTLAYGSNWKFPGGAPVLSTAAGAVDTISYFVAASGLIIAAASLAHSS